jgi:hypothetical protein
MRMSFESAFGLALLLISVGLIAGPYVSGEETLASLVHNKLALFGAAALLLFVIYRVTAAIKEVTTPRQEDTASLPSSKQDESAAQNGRPSATPQGVGAEKASLGLNVERVVPANADKLHSQKAS